MTLGDHQPHLPYPASYLLEVLGQSNIRAVKTWVDGPAITRVLKAAKHDLIDTKQRYISLKQLLSSDFDTWSTFQIAFTSKKNQVLGSDDPTAEVKRTLLQFVTKLVAAGPIPGTVNSSIALKQEGYCTRAALGLFLTALRSLQEQPRNGYFAKKLGGRPSKPWKPVVRVSEGDDAAHTPSRRTRRGHRRGKRYARASANREVDEQLTFDEHVEEEADSNELNESIIDDDDDGGVALGVQVDRQDTNSPVDEATSHAEVSTEIPTSSDISEGVNTNTVINGADHDYDYDRLDDGLGGQIMLPSAQPPSYDQPPRTYDLPPHVGRAFTMESVREELRIEVREGIRREMVQGPRT